MSAAKAPRLDRTSGVPLWAQLRRIVQDGLDSGVWADRFPTELELSTQFGVSRQTVRQALHRLREDGRVISERGRGSRPAGMHEQATGALWSLFRAVEASGSSQTSEVRSLGIVIDPSAAAELALPPDSRLVLLERLRRVDASPMARDRAWLPCPEAEPLLTADFTHTALYDELTRRCGISPQSGEETITAAAGDALTRQLLETPSGVPVLELHRRAFFAGRPIEVRHTEIRADRFRLRTAWQPTGGRSISLSGDLPHSSRPRHAQAAAHRPTTAGETP